ncbi:nuclear transport factor 2 family protein [Acetobacteraceae bacterium H6797]|nr:nuclear transport factor 2 family protein [Acetobacteraceae bacterium H6797]
MSDETAAVLATVQGYFDALYEGSVEGFRKVFHPQAQLFTSELGTIAALDFDSYMARVADRPAPKASNDPRFDEVVSVTIASPSTAHVRVRDALKPNRYVDELLLVKYPDGWKIVCKAWAFNNA